MELPKELNLPAAAKYLNDNIELQSEKWIKELFEKEEAQSKLVEGEYTKEENDMYLFMVAELAGADQKTFNRKFMKHTEKERKIFNDKNEQTTLSNTIHNASIHMERLVLGMEIATEMKKEIDELISKK